MPRTVTRDPKDPSSKPESEERARAGDASGEPENRGGRRATGTVQRTRKGLWQGIITLADGTRKRLLPFPKGTSKALARERTLAKAEEAAELKLTKPVKKPEGEIEVPPELCDEWFRIWLEERRSRGLTSTRENEQHYRCHIRLMLGGKHIRFWLRDDMRHLSRRLDEKVIANAISWKTAINIWGTATKMCDDAAESKLDALRVRDDNPSDGVRGPNRGAEKLKQFLYPSEFLAFVRCERIPLHWRRFVTIAIYGYLRLGELRVLDWEDIDLEHRILHVHRAMDRITGEVKPTKGMQNRRVPIEPALVPLLQAMYAEAHGLGRVCPEIPTDRALAQGLRRLLKTKAGVTRAELHRATSTHKRLTFHDTRSTGLTWLAIRGDDPLKIQQRAGHENFDTTQGYIRTAEAVRDAFGEPFPRLPGGVNRSHQSITPPQLFEILRRGRDSNPR